MKPKEINFVPSFSLNIEIIQLDGHSRAFVLRSLDGRIMRIFSTYKEICDFLSSLDFC